MITSALRTLHARIRPVSQPQGGAYNPGPTPREKAMAAMNAGRKAGLRSAAVSGLAILMFAGCAASLNAPQRPPSAGRMESCSSRVILNFRQGLAVSDFDLMAMARRAGVNMEALQQTGRSSRMVMIRGRGPEAVCDAAIEEMSLDPRIESIHRDY